MSKLTQPTTAEQLAAVERDLAECDQRRAQARALGWPIIPTIAAYELVDPDICGRARLAWALLDELFKRLQNDHQLLSARLRAETTQSSPADLDAYRRRRALVERHYAQYNTLARAEQIADLVIEGGMTEEQAIRRVDGREEADE